MSWYYNDVTGEVFQQTGIGKWAEDRNINIGNITHWPVGDKTYGPYATQAMAQHQKDLHPPTGVASQVHSVLSEGNKATSGITGISGIFQGNLWIRVGEVVLGLVLIAIGVAQLTDKVPVATAIAKKVAL